MDIYWCNYSHKCHYVGLLKSWPPSDGERYIYTGNGKRAKVKTIGDFKLVLKASFILILENTFVVSSFRQNLISVSCLDKLGYFCSFGNETFKLSKILI